MATDILRRIGTMIILVVLQALVFNRIHLFGCAMPLLYVYFVLTTSSSVPFWQSLPMAFVLGLSVDIFSNTPGVASSSLTLLAFIQSYFIRLYLDNETKDNFHPSIATMGFLKYFTYAFTLLFIYCLMFFSLEAFSFFHWQQWLIATFGSFALTLALLLAVDTARK